MSGGVSDREEEVIVGVSLFLFKVLSPRKWTRVQGNSAQQLSSEEGRWFWWQVDGDGWWRRGEEEGRRGGRGRARCFIVELVAARMIIVVFEPGGNLGGGRCWLGWVGFGFGVRGCVVSSVCLCSVTSPSLPAMELPGARDGLGTLQSRYASPRTATSGFAL